MSDHKQFRIELGSYVAGALDPADRARLEEHLAGCSSCREELASYAGLPGLMSRLSYEEVVDQSLLPPPSLLPRLLDAVAQERQAEGNRLRRWRLAAAGLAATAAAAVVLALVPGGVGDVEPDQQFVAAAGSPAAGAAALDPRPWGTSVALTLEDLPPADSYVAFALDDDGERTTLASWGPTDDGSAMVTGATNLPLESVETLTVETSDGLGLLTLTAESTRP